MIKQSLPVKIGNTLFNRCFFLYNFLYFVYKEYEDRETINFLSDKIKPGMNVIDIGANTGFYTVLFSKLVGDKGRVYAFEPDERNYKRLKLNTKKLKNVCLNNCAVGKESGKTRLYLSEELNTRHHLAFDTDEDKNFTEIYCTSIDDYFKKGEKVDFVKIDIEGYDCHAFMGMKKTIERSGKSDVFSEFWPYGLKKAGVNPDDYLRHLKQMGYSIRFFNLEHEENLQEKIEDKSFNVSFYGTMA